MIRKMTCGLCLVVMSSTAFAETRNWIYQYNTIAGGPAAGTHYTINQGEETVYIKAGFASASKRFKFEARTEELQSGQWVDIGPGDIDVIMIDPSVSDPGSVIIEVNGDPSKSHVYGAADLRKISLPTGATAYTHIWRIRIAGNLGADGMSDCDQIDLVEVGGDLLNRLDALGSIGNSITISGILGAAISGSSITGTITAAGAGTHTGSITARNGNLTAVNIGGRMNGNISVAGSLTQGKILVAGSVADGRVIQVGEVLDGDPAPNIAVGSLGGTIRVASLVGDGSGYDPNIQVAGNVTATGEIVVDGDATYGWIIANGELDGNITIGGDLKLRYVRVGYPDGGTHNGNITIGGDLGGGTTERLYANAWVCGTLNGEIRVLGSLYPTAGTAPEIEVTGGLGASGAVSIDWDGWDASDAWDPDATVKIGAQTYTGNTPAARVYEITCERADLNNDGAVNTFDIDPFVLALSSAGDGFDDYAAAFPGLLGSVEFHADLNCDGVVNSFDIDAFTLRLTDVEEWCDEYWDEDDCPDCACGGRDGGGAGREGDGGLGEPAAVAALYGENVAPERLGVVVAAIAELAESYGDTPRGEFWGAVLAELE